MMQAERFSFLMILLFAYLPVRMGFSPKAFDGISRLPFTFFYLATIVISLADMDYGFLLQNAALFTIFILCCMGLLFRQANGVLPMR